MTDYLKLFFVGFILLAITSCGTTNNVSSNRLIQKRKYTRGFHFNRYRDLRNNSTANQIIDSPNKILTQKKIEVIKKESSLKQKLNNVEEQNTEVKESNITNPICSEFFSLDKIFNKPTSFKNRSSIIQKTRGVKSKSIKNQTEDSYDPLAIIGFTLSIIAFLAITFFIYSLTVLSLGTDIYIANVFVILIALALSISFSSVALKHTKNNKRKGRKLAIAGLTIAASIAAISLSYLLIGFIFNYII